MRITFRQNEENHQSHDSHQVTEVELISGETFQGVGTPCVIVVKTESPLHDFHLAMSREDLLEFAAIVKHSLDPSPQDQVLDSLKRIEKLLGNKG